MTSAQNALYWREWARVRDMLRTRGKSVGQSEDYRHELTRRALGVAKSSRDFTNAEFDKVLARLRAEADPANLEAQLAVQESPERRRGFLLQKAEETCYAMWSHGGDTRLMREEARDGYIEGTARRVIGREIAACSDAEIAKVVGCLEARLKRLVARAAERQNSPAPAAEDSGNPF